MQLRRPRNQPHCNPSRQTGFRHCGAHPTNQKTDCQSSTGRGRESIGRVPQKPLRQRGSCDYQRMAASTVEAKSISLLASKVLP